METKIYNFCLKGRFRQSEGRGPEKIFRGQAPGPHFIACEYWQLILTASRPCCLSFPVAGIDSCLDIYCIPIGFHGCLS